MADRPLLVFPQPSSVEKERRYGGASNIHKPDRGQQAERIAPQFSRLQATFSNREARLADQPGSESPELLLVLETAGAVSNFFRAVQRVPGLQWQFEWEDQFDPDENFYDEGDPTKPINGFAYLMLGNQQAMREMIALWKRWESDHPLPNGYAPWRLVFEQLRAIRPWNESDRIRGTGFENYSEEELAIGREMILCEAELSFRQTDADRDGAEERVRSRIAALGGQIVSAYRHDAIHYHGMLFEIPPAAVEGIREMRGDITLLRADDVFLLRPAGQSLNPRRDSEVEQPDLQSLDGEGINPSRPAVAALLDGIPLQNHLRLRDRIVIVNPEEEYPPRYREHGTQMASAIIHGDLARRELPISRRLIARPVMVFDASNQSEAIPRNRLVIDLIHQAVRDLVAPGTPETESVRIINFAIADRFAQFDRRISPWARMLDWLAYQYNLLFIVSAGNHGRTVETDRTWAEWPPLSPQERQDTFLRSFATDARNRRLRPPSEAVNVITVGAIADDGSDPGYLGAGFLPFVSRYLPAHYSSSGFGLRRMIKPDIFVAGGRLPVREQLPRLGPNAAFDNVSTHKRSAGIQVATPGQQGELNRELFDRGTSHSAALTTRAAIQLWDALEELRTERPGELDESYYPVLIKSLLVHGASWRDMRDDLRRALGEGLPDGVFRKRIQRFVGFGSPDFKRCVECTQNRATLLGFGSLAADQAHEYSLPLPPSLSGQDGLRRVTITLAYMSPVNPRNQKYAAANLWFLLFTKNADGLRLINVSRSDCDDKAVQRGTVQHEVFEGTQATAFGDGEALRIKVNAAADASGFDVPVKYGLAVSFEVAETLPIPLYEEISTRVRTRVGIRA